MPSDSPNPSPKETAALAPIPNSVTAIIPARNEEAVIAACVESLAGQAEIGEILVVDDQSSDSTSPVVRGLIEKIRNLRILETGRVPGRWRGKNPALWTGVQQAKCPSLL